MKRMLLMLIVVSLVAATSVQAHDPDGEATDALDILKHADAAIKKIGAVRYKASAKPTGIAENFFSAAEGSAILVGWNGGLPEKFFAQISTTKRGSDEPVDLTGGGDGDTYFLIDHNTKKAYEDMDPGVLGSHGSTLRSLGMMEFVHDAPFDDELKAETTELLGTEPCDGTECYKVRVVYSGGQGESIWFFAKSDFLPRRRIRIFSDPQRGEGSVEISISQLQVDPPVEGKMFKLKLPSGYEQIDDFAP